MQPDPYIEQLIFRCRAVSPGINDYFEEQRYITEVENIEEITPQYLLNTAITLVLDLLEEIGISSNFSVEELLDSSADLETMFYLAHKFDPDNYYRVLKSFDEQQLSEYNAMIENINLPEDYLFEIAAYFNELFPTDIAWEYINRGTEYWYSTDALVSHLVNIQLKMEINTDPNPIPIQEDELGMVQQFLAVMTEREQKVTAYVAYILDRFTGMLNKTKLMRLVKQYDKEKLHPDTILLFSKWNSLSKEEKERIGEPGFLQQHHLKDDHHIEHWEHLKKMNQLVELTNEVAVMIVISLILDELPEAKMKKELERYQGIASEQTYRFMWDLYRQVPWTALLGGTK